MGRDIVFRISENQTLYISLRDFIIIMIIFAFMIFLLGYIIYGSFGKGREKKIKVVDKLTVEHRTLALYRGREETSYHLIVKCVYPDSKFPDKVHTLGCETHSVYDALKKGRTYTVDVRQLYIVKIHSKKT